MKVSKFFVFALSIWGMVMVLATAASAVTISLNPTADGTVRRFGSFPPQAITTDAAIRIDEFRFGSNNTLVRSIGVLEFDLSAIADGSAINGVSLDLVLTRPVTGLFDPFSFQIFALAGDGAVTPADFSSTPSSNVFQATTPQGGAAGDIRSYDFTSLAPVEDVLSSGLLSLRLVSFFGQLTFASLENSDFNEARLNINFTPLSVVPLPAALPLYGTGLAIMGFIGWRREQRKAT